MNFVKMHGCGNDYIYINCMEHTVDNPFDLAVKLSDRHFGIGSDGLICICSSEAADFKMDMYNADGSRGKMCGNGIRCVGKYVYEYGLTDRTCITVETLGGIKTLYLNVEDGEVVSVRVDMGCPVFESVSIPVLTDEKEFLNQKIILDGKEWTVSCVSMGNPHAVVFVENVDLLDLSVIGPLFENHVIFPERINTEFVEILNDQQMKMRVWERGSGETLACGTGTCAAVVVAALEGRVKDSAEVEVLGGKLFVEWNREINTVNLTGPAEIVFEGRVNI